jgi:5'-methylthioadenosine phosphorylase
MVAAIIGGTGVYDIPGVESEEVVIDTEYGQTALCKGLGDASDLIFMARHGISHNVPPHKVNYRANIKALQLCGVKRVVALFAVGSMSEKFPPLELVALDDFLDFTHSRQSTFFEEIDSGVGHVEMSAPFNAMLRQRMVELGPKYDICVHDGGVYAAFNGPRFESPAEIRAARRLGGEVTGMTCLPEVVLAAELGLSYAGLALPINWAAGMKSEIELVEEGAAEARRKMINIALETLRTTSDEDCVETRIL